MSTSASKLISLCILLLLFANVRSLETTSYRGVRGMERGANSSQFLNELVLELKNYNRRKMVDTARVAPGGPDGVYLFSWSKGLIINGTATLVDDEGKPLIRVDTLSDHDSEDEIASVDNDMAKFLASKNVGYGTNSLLEQWKKSYGDGEYDYDPYDDDMYEYYS
nr:hypothetical protein [Tanacetum cinerariifolium]